MGKSKLGRMRKYSHQKYSHPKKSANPNPSLQPVHYPNQFLFSLRNVPSALVHQSSIYNYSRVFTILSNDGTLRHQLNLIKHCELYLMLCTFSTEDNRPVPERTLIINTDFTWRVIVSNQILNMSVPNVPEHLASLESFLLLLDFVDNTNLCLGIQNENLRELAMAGGRNGEFKDRHGKTKAKLFGNTIRTVNCSALTYSGNICEQCKSHKKVLLTMSSNHKCRNYSKGCKTNPSSHCKWTNLTEREMEERIKNCRTERQNAQRKISRLEEKFQKVFQLSRF